MLVDCFQTLDIFGRKPEQLNSIVKIHLLALQEYTQEQIEKSFLQWIKTQSKFPTPTDIINIIKSDMPKNPNRKVLL